MQRSHAPLRLTLLAALAALAAPLTSRADSLPDFTELSLTELMQVRVTSVSRKEQAISGAPASVSVISGEDISRLGATTLASCLRIVPGMQIARIDGHECAVSARGFNDLYSNKLLVLVDGRTIYNQLFSGVFWNQNTVFLGDLDHIEVIRGPGATQWGSNAVNGVVSISSKNAHDTLGTYASITVGDQTEAMVEVREGWKLSGKTAARVYAKVQREDDYGIHEIGTTEGWRMGMVGARLDWQGNSGASATWITEARRTLVGNNSTRPSFSAPYRIVEHENYRIGSVSSIGKWSQPIGDEGTLKLQAYVEGFDRRSIKFGEDRTIIDFDGQLTLHPLPRHELMLGMGFHEERDDLTPSLAYGYSVTSASPNIFSAFVQDEVTLVPDRLKLLAGIKVEKGSLFGWEPQPSMRLVYTPSAMHSLWAAFTHAARSPSRSERDLRMAHTVIPPSSADGHPTAVFLSGHPDFQSEHLQCFEVGYRAQPRRELSYDAAVFFNRYTDLRDIDATFTGLESTGTPHYTIDAYFLNRMSGHTWGAELSAHWRPVSTLQMQATFSTLRYDLVDKTPISPYPATATEGTSPRYQSSLRVSWSFAPGFSADVFCTHQSRLSFHDIPAYTGVDARLAWRCSDGVEIAVVGKDLTDPAHPEFGAYFLSGPVRQITRSVHATVVMRF